MSFPVYTLKVRRNAPPTYRRGARDPSRGMWRGRLRRRDPRPARRASAACPTVKIPIFRVVLRKDRTIRVPQVEVSTPEQAARVAHALIGDSPSEKLLAILIDSNAKVAGAVIIGTASAISQTPIVIRGIFTGAIAHNATAIILAHNHPGGSPQASEADRALVAAANPAAAILGIPIVDNLIVTREPDRWSSFCA